MQQDPESQASRPTHLAGVDTRRLRYFVHVAEELHFGRAAERLHVAQPALSRQIAHLEGAIGAQLFDRSRSQIQLTKAGETLLPRARDIMARVAEAARLTRRAAEGMSGMIEVGFVGSATSLLALSLLVISLVLLTNNQQTTNNQPTNNQQTTNNQPTNNQQTTN